MGQQQKELEETVRNIDQMKIPCWDLSPYQARNAPAQNTPAPMMTACAPSHPWGRILSPLSFTASRLVMVRSAGKRHERLVSFPMVVAQGVVVAKEWNPLRMDREVGLLGHTLLHPRTQRREHLSYDTCWFQP